MKKTLLCMMTMLMGVLMSFTMFSCDSSSDSEITDITNADIVGKWLLNEAGGEKYSNGEFYVMFSANQTYEVFPKGNPFGFSDRGSWMVSESELILNGRTFLKIIKLTSKSMTLELGDMTMKFQRDPNDQSAATSGTAKQLVGKWLERKYEFVGDSDIETFTGDNRYLLLNADYTYKIKPYNLFENENAGGNWKLEGSNILILGDSDSRYKILKISSTTLQLGWLYEGSVIEKVTFEKDK